MFRSIRLPALVTTAVALTTALANPNVIAVFPPMTGKVIGAVAIVVLAVLKPLVRTEGGAASPPEPRP